MFLGWLGGVGWEQTQHTTVGELSRLKKKGTGGRKKCWSGTFDGMAPNCSQIETTHNKNMIYVRNFETNAVNTTQMFRNLENIKQLVWDLRLAGPESEK